MRTGEVGAMVGRAPGRVQIGRSGGRRGRRTVRIGFIATKIPNVLQGAMMRRGRSLASSSLAFSGHLARQSWLQQTMLFLISRLQASAISCSSPLLAWVNSRGFSTATEGAKRLASSTILSCFSMAWRSARSSTQRRATTRLAPCLCGLARFRAIANQVALELATRAGTTAT